MTSAVLLEWHLTIVLAKEVQEALVVVGFHVEEPRDDLVVAARFFEPLAHQIADVSAGDFALHVERIDGRPE